VTSLKVAKEFQSELKNIEQRISNAEGDKKRDLTSSFELFCSIFDIRSIEFILIASKGVHWNSPQASAY